MCSNVRIQGSFSVGFHSCHGDGKACLLQEHQPIIQCTPHSKDDLSMEVSNSDISIYINTYMYIYIYIYKYVYIPSYSEGLVFQKYPTDSIFLCQVLWGPTAVTLSAQANLLQLLWANYTYNTYLFIVKDTDKNTHYIAIHSVTSIYEYHISIHYIYIYKSY